MNEGDDNTCLNDVTTDSCDGQTTAAYSRGPLSAVVEVRVYPNPGGTYSEESSQYALTTLISYRRLAQRRGRRCRG